MNKFFTFGAVLIAASVLAGCESPPPPPPPEPLVYEDPTIPPPPPLSTANIREGALVPTQGSRGGAALRQPEDLAVLYNSHEGSDARAVKPTAYEEELIADAKRRQAEAAAKRKAQIKERRQSAKDKSYYSKKDKSVYAKPEAKAAK